MEFNLSLSIKITKPVLLTIEGSIAVEGIAIILDQFDDHYQVIQEMFASTTDFGLMVLVILNNHLQKFFEMVSDMEDMTKVSSCQQDFLLRQANEFLEKDWRIDDHHWPSSPSAFVASQLRPMEEATTQDQPRRRRRARWQTHRRRSHQQSLRPNPNKHSWYPMARDISTSSQWVWSTRLVGPR